MKPVIDQLRRAIDKQSSLCHKASASKPSPQAYRRDPGGCQLTRDIASGEHVLQRAKGRIAGLVIAITVLVGACDMVGSAREKAAQHLAAGRVDAARIEAVNAIQTDAQDHEAYLILAQALMAQGDLVNADRALTNAARQGGDRLRVDRLRLRVLLKARSYARILEEIVPSPSHQGEMLAEVLAARGQAQLATGKREEARSSFVEALRVVPGLADALLGQAQLIYSDGQPDQALAQVEQVIARESKNAQAWQLKAAMLNQQGKLDEAVTAYERAAAADPAYPIAHLAAAELLIQAGRLEAAQGQVDQARQRSPNAVLVHYTQALIHLARKEYDETLALTREVLRVQPSLVSATLAAASAHLARGELSQSEALLRPRLASAPDDHAARRLLALTLLRGGNASGALDVLRPALSSRPNDPTSLTLGAAAHAQLREFTEATAYYEKIAALQPDSPGALARLGMARYAAGDLDRGLGTLEKAVSLQADDVHADIPFIMLLLERKEFGRALTAAQRLQAKSPNNPIGFNLAGVALIGSNNVTAARASFERAVALDPRYWPAASNLARLDLAEDRQEAAKARIEKALAATGNNIEAMAALMRITGDRGRFIDSLEVARRADPKALAPRFSLASTYIELGLGERALSIAREIAAIAPGRPTTLDLLGSAQLAAGRSSEALATFVDLVALTPGSADVHVRIAQASATLGDMRRAESAYRKALELKPGHVAASIGLAGLYGRTDRLADAIKLAEELRRSNPRSAWGDTLMGDLLFAVGRFREAGRAFEAGLAIEPSGGLVVKQHMAATAAGDRPGDARIAQWLERLPSDLVVRAYLGDLRYLEGEYRSAAEIYAAVIKDDPYRASVHNNLASAYLKLADPRALAAAKAAFELKPDDAYILDTLGVAQMRHGDPAAAVELLRRAIRRLPNAPTEMRVHYAIALAKAGRKDAARIELKTLQQSGHVIPPSPQVNAICGGQVASLALPCVP